MYSKITIPIGLEKFITNNADDFKRFYDTDETPIILGCYPIDGHKVLRLELQCKATDSPIQSCYAIPYNKSLEKNLEHHMNLLNTGARIPRIIASDIDNSDERERYVVREEFFGPTLEDYIKKPSSKITDIFEIYSNMGENLGKVHKNREYVGDLHSANIIILKRNAVGFIDPFQFTVNEDIEQAQLDDIGICLYDILTDDSSRYDDEKDSQLTKPLAFEITENFDAIINSFFNGYQKEVGTKVAEKRKEYVINNYVPAWDFVS